MFGSSSAISHVHLVKLWSSGEADHCWLAVADFCFSENEEKKGEQKEAAASQHAATERGCYRHMLFSTQNTEDFLSVGEHENLWQGLKRGGTPGVKPCIVMSNVAPRSNGKRQAVTNLLPQTVQMLHFAWGFISVYFPPWVFWGDFHLLKDCPFPNVGTFHLWWLLTYSQLCTHCGGRKKLITKE